VIEAAHQRDPLLAKIVVTDSPCIFKRIVEASKIKSIISKARGKNSQISPDGVTTLERLGLPLELVDKPNGILGGKPV